MLFEWSKEKNNVKKGDLNLPNGRRIYACRLHEAERMVNEL